MKLIIVRALLLILISSYSACQNSKPEETSNINVQNQKKTTTQMNNKITRKKKVTDITYILRQNNRYFIWYTNETQEAKVICVFR